MGRLSLIGGILLVVLGVSPSTAQEPAAADTGGAKLMAVWRAARAKYYDALLISISGRTGPEGVPLCSPDAPFQNGWRYSFYSPEQDKYLMMSECQGAIAGPLVQMREKGASRFDIKGKFVDSDVAMQTLARMGVSIDPRDHKAEGKRPFGLQLYRLEDPRFKTHPVVWKIAIGNLFYMVDAVANEKFAPERYGVSGTVDVSTSGAFAAKILSARPARKNVYTVLRDFDRVQAYAREKFPGSTLMAIEGFVDAWGASPCTGPGDGWAHYYHAPKSKGFEVVFSCNGYIGPGPTQFIPVDMNKHAVIPGEFIDTDKLIDSLIIHHPDSMNEGMGRSFKRNGTALLLNHRSSPFLGSDQWNVTLVWQVRVGRTEFSFDARNGKLLRVVEK